VCVEAIGKSRAVIQFDFGGRPRKYYWLLIERADVSVCLKNPGFDIDVIVSTDIVAFYRVWLGRVTLSEALRGQQVRLSGTPADVRAFSGWVGLLGARWQTRSGPRLPDGERRPTIVVLSNCACGTQVELGAMGARRLLNASLGHPVPPANAEMLRMCIEHITRTFCGRGKFDARASIA
jgi:hypothetical protein